MQIPASVASSSITTGALVVDGGLGVAGAINTPTVVQTEKSTKVATTEFVKVYAAPFDALAYNGMQINGSMEVSQELGTASVAVTTTGKWVLDGWVLGSHGPHTVNGSQSTNAPLGFANSLMVTVSVANASPGVTDDCAIDTRIEGYRVARLMWGTANAVPLTIAFWVQAVRPGNYSGVVSNDVDRACAFSFTVNAASTWEYKTVTIPAHTAGTWNKTSGKGLQIYFTLMAGTSLQSAAGVWTTAIGIRGATGTINGVAATSDVFRITGVVVLPGTEVPSYGRSAFIMRPYGEELATCQRYLYKRFFPSANVWFSVLQAYSASGASGPLFGFPVTMRSSPTATSVGTFQLANAAGAAFTLSAGVLAPTPDSLNIGGAGASGITMTAGNAVLIGIGSAGSYYLLDARL